MRNIVTAMTYSQVLFVAAGLVFVLALFYSAYKALATPSPKRARKDLVGLVQFMQHKRKDFDCKQLKLSDVESEINNACIWRKKDYNKHNN